MSTRAEEFAAIAERSGPKKKKSPAKTTKTKKATEARARGRALQKTSGRPAGGKTARRNIKKDDAERATHALEDSGSGRPSRKSTRSGANRVKADSQLKRRQTRATSAPKTRARKAAAKAK
ncbi:hypothetical protein LZC95_00825 [Pendulispora brunnea]|uniref:Uncharacterized protein n=1 Tax=Pendulispora brunnea TaxID=2905690 RepID=A0ABZ2K9R5_9BACT